MARCSSCGARAVPPPTPAEARAAMLAKAANLDHLRLLAFVHKYPPTHNAGAEWMLHHTLKHLNGRGHESRVLVRDPVEIPDGGEVFDGVHITSRPGQAQMRLWGNWATHIVTHLDMTGQAMQMANRYGLPEVHLIHNHRQLAFHRVRVAPRRLAVFNSRWLQTAVAWQGESMVLHPPVPVDHYRLERATGEHVMLFNLSPAKGANLFYALAAAMPDVKFMGVQGAYAAQVPPPDGLPNLTVVPHTADVRQLYAQARLVLMPSSYESWGRIAVEAGCSGIPAVTSDTPGLLEATGDAALHLPVTANRSGNVAGRTTEAVEAPRDDVAAWADGIRTVLADYSTWSDRALLRAVQLWQATIAQLGDLDRRLRTL